MEVPKLIREKVFPGPPGPLENRQRPFGIETAEAALERIAELATPEAEAVFVRVPLLDPCCPKTSDLDLLVFGQVDGLIPERLRLPVDKENVLMVDVIWLPLVPLTTPKPLPSTGSSLSGY